MRKAFRRAYVWCFLIFALFITVQSFIATLRQDRLVRPDLENGHFSVVEGPIEGFHPIPDAEQSFVVQGRRFSCPGVLSQGSASGSPIHDGLRVPITYADDLILRLEAAR